MLDIYNSRNLKGLLFLAVVLEEPWIYNSRNLKGLLFLFVIIFRHKSTIVEI